MPPSCCSGVKNGIMLEQFQMLITPEDKQEFDKICMDKLHREIGRIEGGMKK